jgi:hypothetical protein
MDGVNVRVLTKRVSTIRARYPHVELDEDVDRDPELEATFHSRWPPEPPRRLVEPYLAPVRIIACFSSSWRHQ